MKVWNYVEAERTHSRKVVAVYGNCQAFFLAHMCNNIPSLSRAATFVGISNHTAPGKPYDPIPDAVDRADALWEQFDERKELSIRTEVRDRAAQAQKIVFPPLGLMGFWPFAMPDPANQPEPHFPWGRYPWGDRIAMEVRKRDLKPSDALEAYMDLSVEKMPNVADLLHRDEVLLRHRDISCDVTMGDYVFERIRNQEMFWTWGHISTALLAEELRRLIAVSPGLFDGIPATLDAELDAFVAKTPGIGEEQLPIHPEVVRLLGLTFVPAGRTYKWFTERWTFDEYMMRYLMLDKTW